MTFYRGSWYCAGWAHELSRKPMPRKILNIPIVFYRKEDGSPVALADTCPHRFAPLHLGELRGDAIECPYHGLQFGTDGHCILNPHGGPIPPNTKVASFPLVERHRLAWIWMGEPAEADPDLIPDCSHIDDPEFKAFFSYFAIPGHYELVNDNLLDLTHVRFLHKAFQAPSSGIFESDLIDEGHVVTSVYVMRDTEKSEMLNLMWPIGPDRVDIYTSMRWEAPSNMLQRNSNVGVGLSEDAGITAFTSHLVTPETDTTCHYFLVYSRNWRQDDEAFDKSLQFAIEQAVRDDDGAMIGQVQRRIGQVDDLMGLRPVILSTDSAAIRARRFNAKLIREQAKAEEGQRPLESRRPESVPMG